jgi:hypothetical protein
MAGGVTVPDVASLRLRGEVEGEERTFVLATGENLVGKAPSC